MINLTKEDVFLLKIILISANSLNILVVVFFWNYFCEIFYSTMNIVLKKKDGDSRFVFSHLDEFLKSMRVVSAVVSLVLIIVGIFI